MSLPHCKVAHPRPLTVGDEAALREFVEPDTEPREGLTTSEVLDEALVRGLAHETLNRKQVHFVCRPREVGYGALAPGTAPGRKWHHGKAHR